MINSFLFVTLLLLLLTCTAVGENSPRQLRNLEGSKGGTGKGGKADTAGKSGKSGTGKGGKGGTLKVRPTNTPTDPPTDTPTEHLTPPPTPPPTQPSTPPPTPQPTPSPSPPPTPPPTLPPPTDPCAGLDCGNLANVAASSCVAGECVIGTCDLGHGDCNGIPSDGCESNLNTDLDNCGACSSICDAVCTNGNCDNPDPVCEAASCGAFVRCATEGVCDNAVCAAIAEGGGLCPEGASGCDSLPSCPNGTPDCPEGSLCAVDTCCSRNVCVTRNIFCNTASTQAINSNIGDNENTIGGMSRRELKKVADGLNVISKAGSMPSHTTASRG